MALGACLCHFQFPCPSMWLDDTWWIYRAGLGCKQPLARKWGWALAGWSNCIWTQLLGENCRERERELHCASSTCFSFCGCNHVLQMMWGWWQANFWEGARGGRAFVFASHFCDYVQLQVEVLKNEDILCFVPQARLQTPWRTFLEQWSRDWGRDEGQDAAWEKSTRSSASLFASPEVHEESFWGHVYLDW